MKNSSTQLRTMEIKFILKCFNQRNCVSSLFENRILKVRVDSIKESRRLKYMN